jgi:hypothetical protein
MLQRVVGFDYTISFFELLLALALYFRLPLSSEASFKNAFLASLEAFPLWPGSGELQSFGLSSSIPVLSSCHTTWPQIERRQKFQLTKVVNQERDNGNLAIFGRASLIAANTKVFSYSYMVTC